MATSAVSQDSEAPNIIQLIAEQEKRSEDPYWFMGKRWSINFVTHSIAASTILPCPEAIGIGFMSGSAQTAIELFLSQEKEPLHVVVDATESLPTSIGCKMAGGAFLFHFVKNVSPSFQYSAAAMKIITVLNCGEIVERTERIINIKDKIYKCLIRKND
ncbi:hypothetical protein D5018_09430 [Parashewanella curva]|uniref:Uncharacterized protein n=1 Tax=Parashewanella curva TaxID=2338552 RepID=A0A3L8PWZ3_9GAMM|nr:hypothetical protein [Parashewanella curva]RLV59896.1 hypothetical protein D5018_09430 [Parashewanella curva]